jgi:hypothetical protein
MTKIFYRREIQTAMVRIYRIKEMLNDECGTLNIFNSAFSVPRSSFIPFILFEFHHTFSAVTS